MDFKLSKGEAWLNAVAWTVIFATNWWMYIRDRHLEAPNLVYIVILGAFMSVHWYRLYRCYQQEKLHQEEQEHE